VNAPARNELLKLERSGSLTPENVLRLAEDSANPLHGCFTWSNKEAAHAYRLSEAANLIRTYRVEIRTETREFKLPEFTSTVRGSARQSTLKIPEENKRQVFAGELRRAIGHLERAAKYQAAFGFGEDLFRMVDRLNAMLEQVKKDAAA
jgi:hypothetical protein